MVRVCPKRERLPSNDPIESALQRRSCTRLFVWAVPIRIYRFSGAIHQHCRHVNYESISPTRVYAPQRHPKEPVHTTESGSRLFSFEDSKLLPQSSGFQCKPVARYEQGMDIRDDRNDERTHRYDISRAAVDDRNRSGLIALILLTDQVLMTHTVPKGSSATRNDNLSHRRSRTIL